MAVIVNGEVIEEAEIEEEVARLRPDYEARVLAHDDSGEAGPRQLRQWARENLIERVLLIQAAGAAAIEIAQEEIDSAYEQVTRQVKGVLAPDAKAQIETQLKVDALVARVGAGAEAPNEEQARAFYDATREALTEPERVHASHIVKHVKGEADRKRAYEAIVDAQMALASGTSFEEVARQFSDCPEGDGDLGWFFRGQMVEQFDDVVFALTVGQVSDVFVTSYGYHIAKLHARRAERLPAFEEVKDVIAKGLLNQRQQEAVEAFVDSLKQEAKIEDMSEAPPKGQQVSVQE